MREPPMDARKAFTTIAPESELLHAPFYPVDVRDGDRIFARVTAVTDTSSETTYQVWRISPLGIELLLKKGDQRIPIGTRVRLRVQLGDDSNEFVGSIVTSQHSEGDRELLGIRWHQAELKEASETDRRARPRWLCGSEFLPTGIAPNPMRFN